MEPMNATFKAGVAVDQVEFFDCALPLPRTDCDGDDFHCLQTQVKKVFKKSGEHQKGYEINRVNILGIYL